MTDYRARSPLLHDGYVIVPGQVVPGDLFAPDQLRHLVACRTLEELPAGGVGGTASPTRQGAATPPAAPPKKTRT